MTYRELLQQGKEYLRGKDIEEWDSDAWLLFEFVTDLDRTHYPLHQGEPCEDHQQEQYMRLLKNRGQHIPLQHLTGHQEFMGFDFTVNEHVLVPRQDTELLVLEALKRVCPGMSVLDMCTGSGCILLSLAKLCETKEHGAPKEGYPKSRYTGADISMQALLVAQENAKKLGASVEFIQSDLFENIPDSYDMILSNPPYIKKEDISGLMPEVRDHEPRLALDGGEDGLHFYRKIICQAGTHLQKGGWLLFEIGFDQGLEVADMMTRNGFVAVEVKQDLAGLDRVVLGKRP